MDTPIWDFINAYAGSGYLRLHMPGHKGCGRMGMEALDITEVQGADALYEASGIIAESEKNASALYGSAKTLYSVEGSSQCIQAMVYLAASCRKKGQAPVILAARNAHRSFLHAAALSGTDVIWLMPDGARASLMSCIISPGTLEKALSSLSSPCCGVYVTSPDYLGQCQDIRALSAVCKSFDVPLIADNAHGAYLHFLPEPAHPLDLGADMCCDSAHKTLPALTGCAYLHISKSAPAEYIKKAVSALALFGSTSPSYLLLGSLDLCNRYLAEDIRTELKEALPELAKVRAALKSKGWDIPESDPLHLSLLGNGKRIGERLRSALIEPEYAGRDAAVLLFPAKGVQEACGRLTAALGENDIGRAAHAALITETPEKVMSIRDAVFADCETVPTVLSPGRIAAAPTASCPPAVPVIMPGERITKHTAEICRYYGYDEICVVK